MRSPEEPAHTFDTTDGCIGLATDAKMEVISNWVRSARARIIEDDCVDATPECDFRSSYV